MNEIYDSKIKKLSQCYVESDGVKKWMHDKLGSYLINTMSIYSKNDCIYIYKDGIYVRSESEVMRAIQCCCHNAKESFRKEVYKYIEIAAPVITKEDDVSLIGCANGIFNMKTYKLIPYDKQYFMFHKINAEFNPNVYCEAADKMLDKISCNNSKIRNLIIEMMGYCLYRNCRYQKMFLLRGNGKNGKSTLINAIINVLGEQNVSALSLNDLQDKFKKPELQDKLANICDDLSNVYIRDTEDFKKIATGGIMTMERKNQDPFKYRNYSKLIMAANEIPKSADKSDGYYRRFTIIPLDARISSSDPDYDPNIDDKLKTSEARSYLLTLALGGLDALLRRGEFDECDDVDRELAQYKADNDPIVAFVNEVTIDNIDNRSTQDVFDDFCDWYRKENNKFSTYTKTTFSRTLASNFDVKTFVKDGKRFYKVPFSGQKRGQNAKNVPFLEDKILPR